MIELALRIDWSDLDVFGHVNSLSSFIPSYDSRTCGGSVALVASCARSWQICVKNARLALTRSTMRNEFSTVECVG